MNIFVLLMSVPKISVVIPTYNRPSLLNRAIRSVLQQKSTMSTVEILVVDDCSDMRIDLSEFDEEMIVYIRLEINSGPQIARNVGISKASGDWVLMLDDDDEMIPATLNRASLQIKQVENYWQYPVFFFATTRGHIPLAYQVIHPADLMNNTLFGDFTPVLQKGVFQEHHLSYLDFPEIKGVGCEQLTWLDISSKFGIPCFMTTLVQVNHDAPMRLTSNDNFIRNSYKFALQQDLTVKFLNDRQMQELSPRFIDKKTIGAAIYYLVSGHKLICRQRIRSLGERSNGTSRMMELLSYFPVFVSRFLFLRYKKTFSR